VTAASFASNLPLGMLGSVAEFQRSMIRERQREGIALAKKAGVYKGRKPSLTAGATNPRRREGRTTRRCEVWPQAKANAAASRTESCRFLQSGMEDPLPGIVRGMKGNAPRGLLKILRNCTKQTWTPKSLTLSRHDCNQERIKEVFRTF